MSANYLLVLLLFPLIFKTGLSAEISVFVRMGSSVEMDIQIQELPEFDDLSWRNEKSEIIVKYTNETKRVKLHPSYKDRVDFNDKTFSLTLKNMQKTDSGLYIARVSGITETDIVTYRVSVIDAVEAPVLTVNSKVSINDSCSVNFTCSAQEFMINSTYQNNRCSPEEVTSQINTLILNCSEESITCNHSNPVSWKEVRMSIKELCINNENDSSQVQIGSPFLWPVVGSVAVFVLICFLAFLYIKCKKGDQEQVGGDSTLYAQVEVQVQPQEKLRIKQTRSTAK
ncbi:CD48 antigen-like isoform X2 [Puntigrus tetrazona]|uniref:CD48 antigen-like isoform X2 n=1 Tax=Puntigrus tetrazona TaxID=1606681 RepID=UPI001C89A333|nr:CD48 antigen-like isoform X2 [Puntigrus tetrazona]